jgi:uncharacterized protein YabN with tetrapyrrole methylase and pyrophosphatase domain
MARRPARVLRIVGTGYNVAGHVTAETRSLLEHADRLFYLVTDPATGAWIRSLQPAARSLHAAYREGGSGVDAVHRMVEWVLEPFCEAGGRLEVCLALSGHPGICLHVSHRAARRARELDLEVRMYPAVSFEDCLVADLGVDPAVTGRAIYDATDFVLRPRVPDTGAALVLLGAGVIGEVTYRQGREASAEGLRVLAETLLRHYPGDHEVVLYEASQLPIVEPRVVRIRLSELPAAPVRVQTTLYLPPVSRPPVDPRMRERLGLPEPTAESPAAPP